MKKISEWDVFKLSAINYIVIHPYRSALLFGIIGIFGFVLGSYLFFVFN